MAVMKMIFMIVMLITMGITRAKLACLKCPSDERRSVLSQVRGGCMTWSAGEADGNRAIGELAGGGRERSWSRGRLS